MRLNKITFSLILSLVLVACKKDTPDEPQESIDTSASGLVVLNEGLFQQNNASLTWMNPATGNSNHQLFEESTGRQLGDTGNDIAQYGNKIYIVVNISSTIEVLNATDLSPVQQIEMINGGTPKQPRSIAFSGEYAYVTCFDGYVDVIDTASFSVVERISVGANPEGITIANNTIYVANSGGLNFPDVDSTISIIDATSWTETDRITVGKNPGAVTQDVNGNIYTIARGDYDQIPSRLVRISNNQIDTIYPWEITGITPMNENFLVTEFINSTSSIHVFNPISQNIEAENFIPTDNITTLYNLQFEAQTGNIYVFDASNYTESGTLLEYSSSGGFLQSYSCGIIPKKLVYHE